VRVDDPGAFPGSHRRDPGDVGRPRRPLHLLDRDPICARRNLDPGGGGAEWIDKPQDPDGLVHTVSCNCG